jgi:hypothetical protein
MKSMRASYKVRVPNATVHDSTFEAVEDWKKELCDLIDELTCRYGTWAEIEITILPQKD